MIVGGLRIVKSGHGLGLGTGWVDGVRIRVYQSRSGQVRSERIEKQRTAQNREVQKRTDQNEADQNEADQKMMPKDTTSHQQYRKDSRIYQPA